MLKRRIALFLSAAALVATPGFAQSGAKLADADPAIWVIKDPDTTIYLFGTFHALDGKRDWFNEEVKTAFDQAKELVLELPSIDDPSAIQQAVMKYAIDPSGKKLSDKLSPATRAKYLKALADIGAPQAAFDQFRPFFATMTIVMASAQKLGYTGEKGAEAVLTKAAKEAGKPISGLETIDYQMGLFAGMTDAEQIQMLEETLDQLPEVAAMFARMNDVWTRGDADGFATLMNEMNAQSPRAYELLLAGRNRNWATWIDERLDKPGTVFIAVGAGHLGGKDSVQAILAGRGIESVRVPAQ